LDPVRSEAGLSDVLKSSHRFSSFFERGTRALKDGDTSVAARLLERAVALDSDHIDASLNLGAAYILEKRFSDAAAVLEPLVDLEPDNPMIWINLGAAYLGNPILATDANQRRAIGAFERAIALDPAAPNVAYNLGLVHRDRGEYLVAIDWFRHALVSNPRDRDAQRQIERLQQKIAGSQTSD
jgi:tetratricopeptide (TPR) repeat protein